MIVITIASIVSRQLCKNASIFTMQLDAQNLLYRKPPIEESLQNIGVLAVMKDNLLILEQASTRSITGELLNSHNSQLIINRKPIPNAIDNYFWAQFDADIPDDIDESIEHNLTKKLILHKLIPLSHQATLAEAYLALVEQRCGAVYIYQDNIDECIGLVTFEQLRIYLVEGKLI
jgi:hypothetical protein